MTDPAIHPIVHLCAKFFGVNAQDVCTSMASLPLRARLCAILLFRDCSNVNPDEVVAIMPVLSCPTGHGCYAEAFKDATDMLFDGKEALATPAMHKFTSDFYQLKMMMTGDDGKLGRKAK